MRIAHPRPAVINDWGRRAPAYILYVNSRGRGVWQESSKSPATEQWEAEARQPPAGC